MTPGERFLELHHEKVRRLVAAQCAKLCQDRSWDLDDLIHDVMIALARKQETRGSRYNPARAGVSTYVVRVMRGVVGNRLERQRLDVGAVSGWRQHEQGDDSLAAPDESGLDDAEAARLSGILRDAARALGGDGGVPYRTLVAWLLHDREAEAIARPAGLREGDVWRYVALLLSMLERRAAPEWRAIWHRHRAYVARRSRHEDIDAVATRGPYPHPLKRV